MAVYHLAVNLVMLVWQSSARNEWSVSIQRSLAGGETAFAVPRGTPDPFSHADRTNTIDTAHARPYRISSALKRRLRVRAKGQAHFASSSVNGSYTAVLPVANPGSGMEVV